MEEPKPVSITTEPKTENSKEEVAITKQPLPSTTAIIPPKTNEDERVSAFSLSSIRAKKELEAKQKATVKNTVQLPTESFSENDMLLQWNKYAQKLEDKGQMILHSLMQINPPKLEGFTIKHELPNEGTRIEFERAQNQILGYLRGMLHNHDISIEIIVNEKMDSKKAFTPEEKYNRLKELNPDLEVLRRTFDLDI